MSNSIKSFDFDHWVKLAKKDPEAFEKQREEALENYLSAAPEGTQERLRSLQWRVDMERSRARNPMDAAIRIYDMMWESIGRNMDAIQELADMLGSNPLEVKRSTRDTAKATVLQFKSRTGTRG